MPRGAPVFVGDSFNCAAFAASLPVPSVLNPRTRPAVTHTHTHTLPLVQRNILRETETLLCGARHGLNEGQSGRDPGSQYTVWEVVFDEKRSALSTAAAVGPAAIEGTCGHPTHTNESLQ